MKTTTIATALWSLLLAGTLLAQEPPRNPRGQPADQRGAHGGLVPPEFILQNAKKIGLTQEQACTIEAIAKVTQHDFRERHKPLQHKMQALQQVMQATPVKEEDAIEALNGVLEVENEIKRLQTRMMVKIANVLKREQRAKLAELNQKRMRAEANGAAGRRDEGGLLPDRLHAKLHTLREAILAHPNTSLADDLKHYMQRIHENLAKGNGTRADKLLDEALQRVRDAEK